MARDYSAHQRKIINRYYQHQDTIQSERVAEIVTELFLCESDKKRAQLWKRATQALTRLKVDESAITRVVESGDLTRLADLAQLADAGRAPGQSGK